MRLPWQNRPKGLTPIRVFLKVQFASHEGIRDIQKSHPQRNQRRNSFVANRLPGAARNCAFSKIHLPPPGSHHSRPSSDAAERPSGFPQSRSWFPTQRSGRPQPRSGHSRGRSGKPNQRSGKLRPWSELPKRRSEPLKQRICPKIAQNHQKPALTREIYPFSRITD